MSTTLLDSLLWRLMSTARSHRVLTLLFWTMMTVLAAWQVATRLSINTDSSDMISPKAPFRVAATEFKAAFPDLEDQVLITDDGYENLTSYPYDPVLMGLEKVT